MLHERNPFVAKMSQMTLLSACKNEITDVWKIPINISFAETKLEIKKEMGKITMSSDCQVFTSNDANEDSVYLLWFYFDSLCNNFMKALASFHWLVMM